MPSQPYTMNDQPELLSCPFCGGSAELNQIGKDRLKVECSLCHVQIIGKCWRYSLDWLAGKLIESWNKRTAA